MLTEFQNATDSRLRGPHNGDIRWSGWRPYPPQASERRHGRPRGSEGGWSLLESVISLTLLAAGIVGVATVIISSLTLVNVNREQALAMETARLYVEQMQSSTQFSDIYAAYNAWSEDDPPGMANVPGHTFEVTGLTTHGSPSAPLGGEPSAVGAVFFPESSQQIREDIVDEALGMPRDLNLDSTVDALDHSSDYAMLPILVRLRWRGHGGEKTLELRTILTRR